ISFFFFSSRRRHTRSKRDWSSDVCSSDLFPETTATARLRNQVPAKNRQPFTNKFSAKKTALLQDERYPTSVWASAPAPNEAGVRASRTSPTTNPAAALGPGRARIV